MKELTAMQRRVFDYMVSFYFENDQLPTGGALQREFGWSSGNSAHAHLQALRRKGWIQKNAVGHFAFTPEARRQEIYNIRYPQAGA